MKPLKEVAHSYLALSEAEQLISEGMFREAEESCRKAMEMSRTIPSGEAFDHAGFDAFCQARLSEALRRQARYDDALAAAEKALYYFNRRGELNREDGKFWIAAVFSRAAALQETGCEQDGLKALGTAREMIEERKGELPGRDEMRIEIDKRLAGRGTTVEPPSKKPGYKAWWEFWS
jgi:tetratricopeptide (TPR) repeat protein